MVAAGTGESIPTVWVDADACPQEIKSILFRAAQRSGVQLILVANHPMRVAAGPNIRFIQVEKGFDAADHLIAQRIDRADLLISGDIPLVAEAMEKGAQAISHRGEVFDRQTIRSRLNMRDFYDTLRASGVQSKGPPPLGAAEKQQFANGLDRYLASLK
ncbi:YaiI/YqxD family protein [Aestuariibacter halophilus]|uniref:UPF0178 protein LJ739_05935 n=1 Tax=Fluctibacter halophilus TaxID=226011 RepID=A0ABS8G5J9_9ALTE|nr:YaiI/YqxD family protein [Aestuariibacter halophilus]MCC2615773.1 YaiI/YqxD family protein [Aestuariibacter halophilus]